MSIKVYYYYKFNVHKRVVKCEMFRENVCNGFINKSIVDLIIDVHYLNFESLHLSNRVSSVPIFFFSLRLWHED